MRASLQEVIEQCFNGSRNDAAAALKSSIYTLNNWLSKKKQVKLLYSDSYILLTKRTKLIPAPQKCLSKKLLKYYPAPLTDNIPLIYIIDCYFGGDRKATAKAMDISQKTLVNLVAEERLVALLKDGGCVLLSKESKILRIDKAE